MASTQQLIKISSNQLIQCQNNVNYLRKLINLRLSKHNHLDLNWYPSYFRRLLEKNTTSHNFKKAFIDAVDGLAILNENFPEFEVDVIPTFVTPNRVKEIAMEFNQFDIEMWQSHLPRNLQELNLLMDSDFDSLPLEYFSKEFNELKIFYNSAAEANQTVVCWWD